MAITAWSAKVGHQLDLPSGEGPDLVSMDGDNTDQPIVLEHGDNQNGPRTPELGDRVRPADP